MCIIIAKTKTMRMPTETELRNCFSRNPDGAGFMYVDNGKVVIDKGYMDVNTFIKRFNKLCKRNNNFINKSLVIHCRIGTGGGNTRQNTHPYPLTNDISEMQKLYTRCDVGVAHNGIIADYVPEKSYYNDTQEFIKSFMYNLTKFDTQFYKRKYFIDMIYENAQSKFVILDKNDDLYFIGTFIESKNLKFSNSTYMSYTTYGKYSDYDYDDYYYDMYYTGRAREYGKSNYDYWKSQEVVKEDKKQECHPMLTDKGVI